MIQVKWTKCSGDVWCNFYTVNLEHPNFGNPIGNYIVWSGKDVIYVGSGRIKERIQAHRTDVRFKEFSNLKMTWARVDEEKMKNVERYLFDKLNPEIGERSPELEAISVNWPWG